MSFFLTSCKKRAPDLQVHFISPLVIQKTPLEANSTKHQQHERGRPHAFVDGRTDGEGRREGVYEISTLKKKKPVNLFCPHNECSPQKSGFVMQVTTASTWQGIVGSGLGVGCLFSSLRHDMLLNPWCDWHLECCAQSQLSGSQRQEWIWSWLKWSSLLLLSFYTIVGYPSWNGMS